MKRYIKISSVIFSLTGFLMLTLLGLLIVVSPLHSSNPLLFPFKMIQYMGNFVAGTYLKRLCEYEQSILFFEKAKLCGPPEEELIDNILIELKINKAKEYYIHQKYHKVIDSLILIRSDVSQFSLQELLLYGMSLWHLQEYDKALRICQTALKCCPDNIFVKLFTFRLRLATQDIEGWQEMIHSDYFNVTNNQSIAITIGDLLWNHGHYSDASHIYLNYLNNNPDDPALLYRNAIAAFRINSETGKAQQYFEKLISLDHLYPGARKEYSLLIKQGSWSGGNDLGYFPEHVNLATTQSDLTDLLSIIMDKRQSIKDEFDL